MRTGITKFCICSYFIMFVLSPSFVASQNRLENFRSTNQKAVLVDWHNEFVEPSVNENLLKDARRMINRYSRTLDGSAASDLVLLQNPGNQYFKPVTGEMPGNQKEFLQKAGKENQIDIFVLGSLRESPTGLELEAQLYDVRIDTLSAVESSRFRLSERQMALEELFYRVFNYLDRDGFVHPSPQDFLEKPASLRTGNQLVEIGSSSSETFIAPEELSTGRLAGTISIGGEKTPFWEQWWFWGIIFGTIATAGGLSYYFLVVNQPSNQAEVTFKLPN